MYYSKKNLFAERNNRPNDDDDDDGDDRLLDIYI